MSRWIRVQLNFDQWSTVLAPSAIKFRQSCPFLAQLNHAPSPDTSLRMRPVYSLRDASPRLRRHSRGTRLAETRWKHRPKAEGKAKLT